MWFVVLDQGEEVKQQLQALVKQEGIAAASFVALGAFKRATIAYFDWEKRKYQPIPVDSQVEVLSLLGDVVPGDDDKPNLHAHTVLGLSDGTTRGGHLMEGVVRPTLEITVTETPAHLVRRRQPGLGLALIEAG
jgi:predicted DNA-binding protein with PD1-like motif